MILLFTGFGELRGVGRLPKTRTTKVLGKARRPPPSFPPVFCQLKMAGNFKYLVSGGLQATKSHQNREKV